MSDVLTIEKIRKAKEAVWAQEIPSADWVEIDGEVYVAPPTRMQSLSELFAAGYRNAANLRNGRPV